MEFKYNTKQRTKTIQGLRSFKDTLPKKIKKILNKKTLCNVKVGEGIKLNQVE